MDSPSRESPDASIASGELPHGLTIVSEEALAAPAPGGSKLRERARPARTYRKGMIADVPLMLSLRGSALVRTLPWATLAGGYAAVLHTQVGCQVWPSFCANGNPQDGIDGNGSDNDFIFMHTYAYSAILLASGFGLVMRLNQSLGRYWEARSAVQSMASKWCDAILMSAYMDEEADDETKLREKESAAFARCLLHLGSLLHATAIHTLRCDRSLDSLRARSPSRRPGEQRHQSYTAASWFNGLADDEADFARRNPVDVLGGLEPCERHSLERSTERVHVVLGWLHSLLVKRRKTGGLGHDAPIVSRIYQVLSDGTLPYHAALKVVDTPFPFAYAQLNAFICLVNLGRPSRSAAAQAASACCSHGELARA